MRTIVSNKGNSVQECCCCDPGICDLYRTPVPPRVIGRLGPFETKRTIAIGKQEVLEKHFEASPPSRSPVMMNRPSVELSNRHEGYDYELVVNVRAIQFSAAILLEGERKHVCVSNYTGYQGNSLS